MAFDLIDDSYGPSVDGHMYAKYKLCVTEHGKVIIRKDGPSGLRHVKQVGDTCLAACLAMLTNKPLGYVLESFPAQDVKITDSAEPYCFYGIPRPEAQLYLWRHGLTTMHLFANPRWVDVTTGEDYPMLLAWRTIVYELLMTELCIYHVLTHAVVVDHGVLYNPQSYSPQELDDIIVPDLDPGHVSVWVISKRRSMDYNIRFSPHHNGK